REQRSCNTAHISGSTKSRRRSQSSGGLSSRTSRSRSTVSFSGKEHADNTTSRTRRNKKCSSSPASRRRADRRRSNCRFGSSSRNGRRKFTDHDKHGRQDVHLGFNDSSEDKIKKSRDEDQQAAICSEFLRRTGSFQPSGPADTSRISPKERLLYVHQPRRLEQTQIFKHEHRNRSEHDRSETATPREGRRVPSSVSLTPAAAPHNRDFLQPDTAMSRGAMRATASDMLNGSTSAQASSSRHMISARSAAPAAVPNANVAAKDELTHSAASTLITTKCCYEEDMLGDAGAAAGGQRGYGHQQHEVKAVPASSSKAVFRPDTATPGD
ncbi:unnamed protein product, partial [Amoebophrya sp. A120]